MTVGYLCYKIRLSYNKVKEDELTLIAYLKY